MMRTAGLTKSFWAEAARTAYYVMNRFSLMALEMWAGKPIDYSTLYSFGCPMYVMYNVHDRAKLDLISRRFIFLRYANVVKGYRLWDPTAHKVENDLEQEDSDSSEVTLGHEERESIESEVLEVQRPTREETVNLELEVCY
ncbi:hypothetical protein LWI29_034520 [Acer saccharum]|uniref:Retroviral polymerase SH3-like domain-containing protein n=1 Tax=Acer saccharum TaxID=4024 RepID=A0AA39TAU0_ACESA|nr:hypothetical protein LWI29_034520 [Acer saccharum]